MPVTQIDAALSGISVLGGLEEPHAVHDDSLALHQHTGRDCEELFLRLFFRMLEFLAVDGLRPCTLINLLLSKAKHLIVPLIKDLVIQHHLLNAVRTFSLFLLHFLIGLAVDLDGAFLQKLLLAEETALFCFDHDLNFMLH